MRFKIKLDLESLPIEDVLTETSRVLNKILGHNNKWHDLEYKPYTCSLISGGKLVGKSIHFNNDSHIYINTEDEDVINAITSNEGLEFSIENIKVYKGYNILTVNKLRYNKNGKTKWITDENKDDFIRYVKQKYGVLIEILKVTNSIILYKNNSKISVNNLLIKTTNNKNVSNLFESGMGGSCSIGLGFVEPLNNSI